MPFEFEKLEIGAVLVKPKIFGDSRGWFAETYKQSEFAANGITDEFNQDNHSKSSAHVLRGLHYQEEPYGQGKLVRCIRGRIYDVAADIKTGKWVRVELSEDNKRMLYIPKGLLHGFVVLSDEAEVVYKVSGEYSPQHERSVLWKSFGIDWGIDFEPLLSGKDSEGVLL